MKKCFKMTSLSPTPVEPLIGRPRDLYLEVTVLKTHIHERIHDDQTSGKWSKNPDGRTDRRPDGHSHFYICEPLAADKNELIYYTLKHQLEFKADMQIFRLRGISHEKNDICFCSPRIKKKNLSAASGSQM